MQKAGGSALTVGAIDVKQERNRGLAKHWHPQPAPTQEIGQKGADRLCSTRTHAGHAFKAAVVGGHFQLFKGVDAEVGMNARSKFGAETWDHSKELLGVQISA